MSPSWKHGSAWHIALLWLNVTSFKNMEYLTCSSLGSLSPPKDIWEGLTWGSLWVNVTSKRCLGGSDMRLFMGQCRLQKMLGRVSPSKDAWEGVTFKRCLGGPDIWLFMGQCYLPQQECWHVAMLVIVSAPCCERCNTLLPAGVASHFSEGLSTCGHPVPMLVMPLWSRAL